MKNNSHTHTYASCDKIKWKFDLKIKKQELNRFAWVKWWIKIYDYNESVFGNDLPHPTSFVILRPKTATKSEEQL